MLVNPCRDIPSRADSGSTPLHPRPPPGPPLSLLHVLLPGLTPQTQQLPPRQSYQVRAKPALHVANDRGALLLSIIRGENVTKLSEHEIAARRARDVLLEIIRHMSTNHHQESTPAETLHSATQCAAKHSPITPSTCVPPLSAVFNPLAQSGMTRTALISSRHIHRVTRGKSSSVSQLHTISSRKGVTASTLALTSIHPKADMPLSGDDEPFSDATSSTTARDNGSISLETISSSESTSRPSRPTAFAVPLFMQSPDPLTVPIPVFASAAI